MKCKKLFAEIMAVVLAIVSTAPLGAAFTSVPVMAASGVDMYRIYNPNSGEHFYTASATEKETLMQKGWNYEGIGWVAPKSGKPVYRLYNPNAGDHHYTTSAAERDSLIRSGWKYENVGWYSGGSVPLYRQYNPYAATGTHNYTTNKSENDALVRAGWRAENIGWYGVDVGRAPDAGINYEVYDDAFNDARADAYEEWTDDGWPYINYSGQCMYYDLTGNGVKELILHYYGNGTYSRLYVYTIRNGSVVRLYGKELPWGNVLGVKGRSLYIETKARMSDPWYSAIRWNGSRFIEQDRNDRPPYTALQTYELDETGD